MQQEIPVHAVSESMKEFEVMGIYGDSLAHFGVGLLVSAIIFQYFAASISLSY